MVFVSLARDWDLEVERGPDWLIVRPRRVDGGAIDEHSLAEQVWSLLEQNFTHRLVLELDEIGTLDNQLVEQIVWLHDRVYGCDGLLRIAGLSIRNQELLHKSDPEGRFPHFRDREEAVMGRLRPRQPR
jgi:hypothetical protein